jgi:AraC-like DNA-binding protein
MNPLHTVSQEYVQLRADRPVRVQEFELARAVEPHDHDYYEICVIRTGTGVHETQLYRSPLRAGSVVVIPPGGVHAISHVKGVTGTNVYYLAEWLLADLRSLWEHDGLVPLFLAERLFRRSEKIKVPQFDLSRKELAACLRELADIDREGSAAQPSIVLLKACLLKFLIALSRAYARSASRELGFQFRREVWRAMEHVEECVGECRPLRLTGLAQQLGLSPDHLTRIFSQATGWPLIEFYQRRRVQRACGLLLNPAAKVTDVGYALGYADTAHLCRFFKRYVGLSPRAYRKKYLSDLPYFGKLGK